MNKLKLYKKRIIVPFLLVLIITVLNLFKHPYVFYLPFNIPGKQMASTIPPFGIFIESKYKNENKNNPCSIIKHKMVHWYQYKRLGLFAFHYNYLKCYFNYGRVNNWMEDEARIPCKGMTPQ